jgi:hypothetical protein
MFRGYESLILSPSSLLLAILAFARRWREELRPRRQMAVHTVAAVESKGCG